MPLTVGLGSAPYNKKSNLLYEDKEVNNKRTIDEVMRGTDKEHDEEEVDDEDEKRKEAMRHIKKQHNGWMLAMTDAQLRITKHAGNTYQHDRRTTNERRRTTNHPVIS